MTVMWTALVAFWDCKVHHSAGMSQGHFGINGIGTLPASAHAKAEAFIGGEEVRLRCCSRL